MEKFTSVYGNTNVFYLFLNQAITFVKYLKSFDDLSNLKWMKNSEYFVETVAMGFIKKRRAVTTTALL